MTIDSGPRRIRRCVSFHHLDKGEISNPHPAENGIAGQALEEEGGARGERSSATVPALHSKSQESTVPGVPGTVGRHTLISRGFLSRYRVEGSER